MKNQKKQKDSETSIAETTNGSILPAMIKAYGGPFWFAGILHFVINALTIASPLLLNELITYTTNVEAPFWQGLLLTFALFVVTFASAVLNGQYFLKTFLVGFRIRTGVISAIYRKALRISSAAKKDTTVGEIVNLMAIDAQSFFELVSYVHILWSGPIVIGVVIWLLWIQLGVAVVSGLVIMILMFPVTGLLATKIQEYQAIQMKNKDERVKLMNEVLNGMKVLKLYAWEPSFETLILGTREKEMVVLRKAAILNSATYFVWILVPFLVSLASYVTFVLLGNKLTPNIAFVSMALFNVLSLPMTMGKFLQLIIDPRFNLNENLRSKCQ